MNITANGEYQLRSGTDTTVVYVSGNLGAATVNVVYKDGAGSLIPFSNGALVANDQYKIEHGMNIELLLEVSGADGSTNFWIETHAMN